MPQDSFFRRQFGVPIEETLGPQSALAQSAEQNAAALQNKLQALRGISGHAGAMAGNPQAGAAPDAMGASPRTAPFTDQERDLKIQAMMQGPEAMAQAAQKLRAQAAMDAQAEAHANTLEGPMDMSGYKDYPREPKFQQLRDRMQPAPAAAPAKPDVRDSLSGMVEVTPELEKKLGYGAQDEEEEGPNKKGSSREVATRGGV